MQDNDILVIWGTTSSWLSVSTSNLLLYISGLLLSIITNL